MAHGCCQSVFQFVEEQSTKVTENAPKVLKPHKLTLENHIVYGDVKVGDVFGVRTLLDNMTCSKYVLSNSIKFAEQLCISAEAFYDKVRDEEDAKQSN